MFLSKYGQSKYPCLEIFDQRIFSANQKYWLQGDLSHCATEFNANDSCTLQNNRKKECIPVGCILPAH